MSGPPQIQLGALRVAFLCDGFWYNDGGCMFGVVPRPLWRRYHSPDRHNRIRLSLVCPLVIRGAQAVLVDCGIGNRLSAEERRIFSHDQGWLLEGLAALGMEPGDVSHVVLSHLHFDHCGGLVRRRSSGALVPAFPNARLFVQRGELECARGGANERFRAAYRHVEECLAPLIGQLELIDGDIEIAAGVSTLVSGGHTRQHQVAMVRDGGQGLLHLADIVPTRSHLRAAWNQAYDLDPLTTMERKGRYLEQALEGGWWVSFAHDPAVFAARLRRDSGRWELSDTIQAQDAGGRTAEDRTTAQ